MTLLDNLPDGRVGWGQRGYHDCSVRLPLNVFQWIREKAEKHNTSLQQVVLAMLLACMEREKNDRSDATER